MGAESGDSIEQGSGDGLDAEVDGGEEAVVHEDDVAAMGVGDHDFPFGIEEGDVALDHKRQPAGIGEETPDFLIGGGRPGDGWLADQQAEPCVGLDRTEKDDLVTENLIVKMPALQIGDGGRLVFLVGPVNDEKPEKVGPSGFEVGFRFLLEPDLVFVSFVVGSLIQFDRRGLEDESVLFCVGAEDSEFLVEIGRTALKARNCFAAAS